MEDKYIFLGRSKAGKTVCFTTMAYQMQQWANDQDLYSFRYLEDGTTSESPNKQSGFLDLLVPDYLRELFLDNSNPSELGNHRTSDYIYNCVIRQLGQQHWPDHTEITDNPKYTMELVRKCFFGMFAWRNVLEYSDYPGEAFDAAFMTLSEMKINNINKEIRKSACEIREKVNECSGIFLIIDYEAMENRIEIHELSNALERLFRIASSKRIAIMFNKLELCAKPPELSSIVTSFKKTFPNAYSRVTDNMKFFKILPLGKIVRDNEGNEIPPPANARAPRVLDPFKWMFSIPDSILKWEIPEHKL